MILYPGFGTLLHAQTQSSVVWGRVLDSSTQAGVEYAGVTIQKQSDSSVVNGVITDAEGKFQFTSIPFGQYFLKVSFVGYTTYFHDFTLNEEHPRFGAGTIALSQSNILQTVQVTGDKPFMQTDLDKRVYNVDKAIVAQNGSASDVLQTIPSVTIDMDGNVTLRGSTAVQVFIDGKPSGIMGDNMEAILDQIPANTIASIEVITNPSAKYDAQGTAGIINIVLRKNKQPGINGTITPGIGTTPHYEINAGLNYRNKKINFYSNYSYNYDDRDTYGSADRYNFFSDTAYSYDSKTLGERSGSSHFARAGIDYMPDSKNTISLSGNWNISQRRSDEDLLYDFYDVDSIFSGSNDRVTAGYDTGWSYNATLDYKKEFRNPKNTLTASAYYAFGNRNNTDKYTTTNYAPSGIPISDPAYQNIRRTGNNGNFVFQSDYVLPLKNANQFEAGIKLTSRTDKNSLYSETLDSLTDIFMEDTLISNQFNYREDVYAAYATWGGKIYKIQYKAGLRAEQTYTDAKLITTDQHYVHNYLDFFPSLHLAYQLSKTFEMTASYSRRINRPNSWELNPFPDYSDAYSFREGNPFLNPEYIDSYEFGFDQSWKNHSLYATLYYHETHGSISRIIFVDTSGIAVATFANANTEQSYGAELIVHDQFFPWWSSTASFNGYRNSINATNVESGLSNSAVTWSGKLLWNFQIMQPLSLQVSANYFAPWVLAQGESVPIWFIDMAARSDFLHNRLSATLSLSDIFNTRKFGLHSEGPDYISDFTHKHESRILSLQVIWRFGNAEQMKKRMNRSDNFDQENPVNQDDF